MATVLIIDDSLFMVRYLAIALGPHGFDTRPASTKAEVILNLVEEVPDVILLDCNMPDISGAELVVLLRTIEALARIPIIMMSASEAMLADHLTIGAQAAVAKPIQIKELVQTIGNLVAPDLEKGQLLKVQVANLSGDDLQPAAVLRVLPGHETYIVGNTLPEWEQDTELLIHYDSAAGTHIERRALVQGNVGNAMVLVPGEVVQVSSNNRRFRHGAELPVRLRAPGGKFRMAQSLDLTLAGITLKGLDDQAAPGSAVELQLILSEGGKLMEVSGTLARLDPTPAGDSRCAVEFGDLSPNTRQALAEFLFEQALAGRSPV